MTALDSNTLQHFDNQYANDADLKSLHDTIQNVGIRKAVFTELPDQEFFLTFDHEIGKTEVTDQKISGRCWIYAAMNVANVVVSNTNGFSSIRLSENFIAFYDLLEKSNYFLEAVIDTIEHDMDSRLVWTLMQKPIDDAGQWFFFQNIIEKYGIVTEDAMLPNRITDNTNEMIDVLSDLLKEFAGRIRMQYHRNGGSKTDLYHLKHDMLFQVYKFLRVCLGRPPQTFCCVLQRRAGDKIIENNITPQLFYQKYCKGIDFNRDYCSLVNIPLNDKFFYKTYCVQYVGNVWEAPQNCYLNLPMDVLKKYVIQQLEIGCPVWIGCDSSVYLAPEKGIYATQNYRLEKYGFRGMHLQKKHALQYGLSKLRHAMTVVGVSYGKNHKPEKWLVKNSYGLKSGHQGYVAMTDEWFSLFVYQVVIKKELLDQALLELYDMQPILLKPWDILGTLAN